MKVVRDVADLYNACNKTSVNMPVNNKPIAVNITMICNFKINNLLTIVDFGTYNLTMSIKTCTFGTKYLFNDSYTYNI